MLRKTKRQESQLIIRNLQAKILIQKVAAGERVTSLIFHDVFLSGKDLAAAVQKNPHLQSLEMENCHLEEAKEFVTIVPRLKQLKHFVCRNTLQPSEEKLLGELEKPQQPKTPSANDDQKQPDAKIPPPEKPISDIAFLTKPEIYLSSFLAEPPLAKANTAIATPTNIPDKKTQSVASSKQQTPQIIFFEGIEDEQNAISVLSNPSHTRQLTPRRISILMRLISTHKEMKLFIDQFKSKLTLHQLTTVAEHQKLAAKILLDDPTIPLTAKELARIGIAHIQLLNHPRIVLHIHQFNLENLADIYRKLPAIAMQETIALLDAVSENNNRIPSFLNLLYVFITHQEIAKEILAHPALSICFDSHPNYVTNLIAHIGRRHPELVLGYLHLLNDNERAYLCIHSVIADQLLLERYQSSVQILFEIAVQHPTTLGLAVLANPVFIQQATKEMIYSLGLAHPELIAYILEVKALREKLSVTQLFYLCKDHHHLKMRLLDYQVVNEIPDESISWKIAHDLTMKSPESLSVMKLAFIYSIYPDLAAYIDIAQHDHFKILRDQFTLSIKIKIAYRNLCFAENLVQECEKTGLNHFINYELSLTWIFIVHQSLTEKYLHPRHTHDWLNFLKPDSLVLIGQRHLIFAAKLLFDNNFTKILDRLTEAQIITMFKSHRDYVLSYALTFTTHALEKVRAAAPKILDFFQEKAAIQAPAQDFKTDATIPSRIFAIDALHERLHALLNTDLTSVQMREEVNNIFPFDKAVRVNQIQVIQKYPHDLNQRGICAGIGLDYGKFIQKHLHDAFKNYAQKFDRILQGHKDPSNSNLLDRTEYLQYYQSRQLCNPIYTKSFSNPTEEVLNQEIASIVQMLFTHSFLLIVAKNHAIYLVKHPIDGTFIIGNANTSFTPISYSDLVHKLKEDFSSSGNAASLPLRVFPVPIDTIKIPPALKKPAHLKTQKYTIAADAKRHTHPEVLVKRKQLQVTYQCTLLELRAKTHFNKNEITLAASLLIQAIGLRTQLPKAWDINQKKLAENYELLKQCYDKFRTQQADRDTVEIRMRFAIYLIFRKPPTPSKYSVSETKFIDLLLKIGEKSFIDLFLMPRPFDKEKLLAVEKAALELITIGLDMEAREILRRLHANYIYMPVYSDINPDQYEAVSFIRQSIARISKHLGKLTEMTSAHHLGERLDHFCTAFKDTEDPVQKAKVAKKISDTYLYAGNIHKSVLWLQRSAPPTTVVHASPKNKTL